MILEIYLAITVIAWVLLWLGYKNKMQDANDAYQYLYLGFAWIFFSLLGLWSSEGVDLIGAPAAINATTYMPFPVEVLDTFWLAPIYGILVLFIMLDMGLTTLGLFDSKGGRK